MAHHTKISRICAAVEAERQPTNDVFLAKITDAKAEVIAESIRHQVLCPLTAFVCIGKKLSDGTLQEYQGKRVTAGISREDALKYLNGLSGPNNYIPGLDFNSGKTDRFRTITRSYDVDAPRCSALPKTTKTSAGFDLGIGSGIRTLVSKVGGLFNGLFGREEQADTTRKAVGEAMSTPSSLEACQGSDGRWD